MKELVAQANRELFLCKPADNQLLSPSPTEEQEPDEEEDDFSRTFSDRTV